MKSTAASCAFSGSSLVNAITVGSTTHLDDDSECQAGVVNKIGISLPPDSSPRIVRIDEESTSPEQQDGRPQERLEPRPCTRS